MGKKSKRGSTSSAVMPAAQTPGTPKGPSTKGSFDEVPVAQPAPQTSGKAPAAPGTPSTTAPASDKTRTIMEKVDSTTKVMEANIKAATQRGENLNELQDKSQAIAESSKQFAKTTKQVKRNLWWKNMKYTIIIVFVVVILLGIVGLVVWKQLAPSS